MVCRSRQKHREGNYVGVCVSVHVCLCLDSLMTPIRDCFTSLGRDEVVLVRS